jgi:hypothetical protein
MIKKTLIIASLAMEILAGVYVVPQGYDNLQNSVNSKGSVVITNSTPTFSGNFYTLGGRSLRYRCAVIPKINCVAGTLSMEVGIDSHSLKRAPLEELLMTFQIDDRVEEDTANYYVCGGAYGGQVWDESLLTSTQEADGSTNINYSYTPNKEMEELFFFTSEPNGSTNSFMIINHSQICR